MALNPKKPKRFVKKLTSLSGWRQKRLKKMVSKGGGLVLGQIKTPKANFYILMEERMVLVSPSLEALYETLKNAIKKETKRDLENASANGNSSRLVSEQLLTSAMVGIQIKKGTHRGFLGILGQKDGVSVKGLFESPLLEKLGVRTLTPTRSLSLTKKGSTVFYLHLPAMALRFLSLKLKSIQKTPWTPFLFRLLQNFSGEVALIGEGSSGMGIVVGTQTSPKKLVEQIGKILLSQGSTKISKTKMEGKTAFKIETRFGIPGLPFKGEFYLTHVSSGVVLATKGLAQRFMREAKDSGKKTKSTVKETKTSSRNAKTSDENKPWGSHTLLGIRSPLSDPMHALDPAFLLKIKQKMPAGFWKTFECLRFTLDSLRNHKLHIYAETKNRLNFSYRIRSLHRQGHPEDTKARTQWRKALRYLYEGEKTTALKEVRSLAENYPKTPYASLQNRLSGSWLTTAMVGLTASVGIPAFLKYLRASKTAEAASELRLLSLSARLYYEKNENVDRTGQLVKSFPLGDTGWTPPSPCCKNPQKVCRPTPSPFTSPIWRSLQFAPSNVFRYQYRFVGKKTGADATFTAWARGDLDCDGVYSLYSIQGRIEKGKPIIGRLVKKDPLE